MAKTPDNNPSQSGVQYDPNVHEGLLYFAGKHVIVADAKQADLMSMPEDMRTAIAKEIATQLALMDFSRGVGGVLIEIVDEARAFDLQKGYNDGLKLLGFEYDVDANALKKLGE